jgi:hypothetical protein
MEELKKAQEEFNIALNHFNYADSEHIDKAIEELNEAENNLNEVIKKVRE